ncbi:MAG TPA: FUSC family protein [Galbitalea sp.]|jgi:hypothetical protein
MSTEWASERARKHPLRNWRQPLLTIAGMAITVALVNLVGSTPAALVLAAVLAMTFGRNQLVTSWRGRAEAIILLPIIALATYGVAELLGVIPIVGAVAYVAAIFLSVWLRRFGSMWRRIGSLIALPFITLLIVPGGGAGTTPFTTVGVSLGALVVVVLLRMLAEATHFVPRAPSEGARPGATPQTRRQSTLRPIASTRMAIQMAVAVLVAILVGVLLFPQHITWVVLTAFLVNSGNRGRADVLYKSGLRIVGAAAGTIVASALVIAEPHGDTLIVGPWLVALLLVILAIGMWLREWTYAAWALAMTLVITLLQGAVVPIPAGTGAAQIWLRILAIVVGAVIGVAAAWFVLPLRSENVVRSRISDALAALGAFVQERSEASNGALSAALVGLDEISAPWRALERMTRWRATSRKPGEWILRVHESALLVRGIPQLDGESRRALGEARKSVRDPMTLGAALRALHEQLLAQVGD